MAYGIPHLRDTPKELRWQERRLDAPDLSLEQGMSTLYDRLGGAPAVNAAVDIFYRKVLADERISHFFEGVDVGRLAAKQKAFLTFVFGGPNSYDGKSLRDGHRHLVAQGLSDVHFDAVIEDLAATLKELGVSDGDIAEVAGIAQSVRNDVLDR
jgi:hemoglobin